MRGVSYSSLTAMHFNFARGSGILSMYNTIAKPVKPFARLACSPGPREPQGYAGLTNSIIQHTIIHYLSSSRAARATPLSCSSSIVFTQPCTFAHRARGSYITQLSKQIQNSATFGICAWRGGAREGSEQSKALSSM